MHTGISRVLSASGIHVGTVSDSREAGFPPGVIGASGTQVGTMSYSNFKGEELPTPRAISIHDGTMSFGKISAEAHEESTATAADPVRAGGGDQGGSAPLGLPAGPSGPRSTPEGSAEVLAATVRPSNVRILDVEPDRRLPAARARLEQAQQAVQHCQDKKVRRQLRKQVSALEEMVAILAANAQGASVVP